MKSRYSGKIVAVILVIFISGCASSSKNGQKEPTFENLVEIQKPKKLPQKSSEVYVDSVKQIIHNKKQVLLIYGTFPDGCTKLKEATAKIAEDSLRLHLAAWRNPQMMCTQVLTPFSFLFRGFDENEINTSSKVIINDSAYPIEKRLN